MMINLVFQIDGETQKLGHLAARSFVERPSPVDAASTGQCVVAEVRRLAVIQIAAQHVHGIDCTQQRRGIESSREPVRSIRRR
jgi:hypothetical protein